jgi:hypothetical protein
MLKKGDWTFSAPPFSRNLVSSRGPVPFFQQAARSETNRFSTAERPRLPYINTIARKPLPSTTRHA